MCNCKIEIQFSRIGLSAICYEKRIIHSLSRIARYRPMGTDTVALYLEVWKTGDLMSHAVFIEGALILAVPKH